MGAMIRFAKWLLLAFLLSALFGSEARATNIAALTCSQTDVSTAIGQAVVGDTVVIPSCPSGASWTTTVTVGKGITLQGQGIGQTVLIDNVPKGNSNCGGAAPLLSVNSNAFFRLTGFTIQGGVSDSFVCQPAHVAISGSSPSFRIDNIAFTNMMTVGIRSSGSLFGVVDHCTFQGSHKNGLLIEHNGFAGASYGDGSWAAPTALGSSQFIFIENCTFTDPGAVGAGAFDVDGGGRVVFRHNTAAFVVGHGTETSGRFRGMRAFEIYNNTFIPVQNSQFTGVYLRSGTGVIYNNTFNDSGSNNWSNVIIATNYRDSQPYNPWGQCNGTSSYDGSGGYPCIDQVGRGQGILLSGSPASPVASPNEALDPVYQWGNTHNGASVNLSPQGPHIQPNRDYYDNVAKPGYTAFPYPHPLTLGSGTPPAPPTNLQGVVN
jgi:hypothetical protein